MFARHCLRDTFTSLGGSLSKWEIFASTLSAILIFPMGYLPQSIIHHQSRIVFLIVNPLIWGFAVWSAIYVLQSNRKNRASIWKPRFSVASLLICLSFFAVVTGWGSNQWYYSKQVERIESQLKTRWRKRGARADVFNGKIRGVYLSSDQQFQYLNELRNIKTIVTEIGYSGSQVTDAGLAHLDKVSQIEELVLSKSLITDSGMQYLADLSALEDLSLEGTGISDQGLSHLVKLQTLRTLVLSNTPITDAGIEYLEKLKGLRTLYLDGTSVSNQATENLRMKLPDCYIHN